MSRRCRAASVPTWCQSGVDHRRLGGRLRRGGSGDRGRLVRRRRSRDHAVEDLGPVGRAEPRPQLRGPPAEHRHTAGGQQQHEVAVVEVGDVVRDHEDRPPGVGQLAQPAHDLLVQRRIEAGRRLVQHQQRRRGQQFERDRHPFALPAGQPVDRRARVLGQPDFAQRLGDALPPGRRARVLRQAQPRRIGQRAARRQLGVDHVVLRHHPDPPGDRRTLAVHVVAVVGDPPARRRQLTGKHFQQGRLARARRPDDGDQLPGPEVERDPRKQRPAADGEPRVVGDEPGPFPARRDQVVAVHPEVRHPDGDPVPVGERRAPGDRDAVDQRRVAAAEVGEPPRPADPLQPRVAPGDLQVPEHDVVVGRPADRDPDPVAEPHAGQPVVVVADGTSPGSPRSSAVPSTR
jgi:hypothetical protein